MATTEEVAEAARLEERLQSALSEWARELARVQTIASTPRRRRPSLSAATGDIDVQSLFAQAREEARGAAEDIKRTLAGEFAMATAASTAAGMAATEGASPAGRRWPRGGRIVLPSPTSSPSTSSPLLASSPGARGQGTIGEQLTEMEMAVRAVAKTRISLPLAGYDDDLPPEATHEKVRFKATRAVLPPVAALSPPQKKSTKEKRVEQEKVVAVKEADDERRSNAVVFSTYSEVIEAAREALADMERKRRIEAPISSSQVFSPPPPAPAATPAPRPPSPPRPTFSAPLEEANDVDVDTILERASVVSRGLTAPPQSSDSLGLWKSILAEVEAPQRPPPPGKPPRSAKKR